ncbi:hypothetical protein [Flavobacterium sp. SORGH_AS_0622]|uniref:hypothetical protein n=1 Tax=Flavobacterium sp. SORGH_AS_0622 TaxID=3041772 RepID=UPI00277EFD24|nr:hypothetical protein [Flavobacterium sp. SORGH_AS_0622]MDQ1165673.1 hypothetical protein [Flavobacterium sp. SORGH_AS_0622]
MKILCLIFIAILFLSCNKIIISDNLNFVPEKTFKIKNLNLSKKKSISIGSYVTDKDSVISQYKIHSKYSLIVIKLSNISSNLVFNSYKKSNCPTPGYFSTINEDLFEMNISPKIFNEKEKIKTIDFIAEQRPTFNINNDSVKNFTVNFNKLVIKINDDANKVIYGKIEYYGLKNLDAEILFYKVENEGYLFILTPSKEKVILEKNILYQYLFE